MFPSEFSWRDPIGWFAIWRGGLVFQGAIVPGFIFVWFYLRKHGLPFWKTLDIASPAMALCHAIGRLGCFLKGCCYGKRTDLPWGIPFRRVPWDVTKPLEGSPAFQDHCIRYGLNPGEDHWSFPVHPTQLYSSLALLLIFFLLIFLSKKTRVFDGFVFCTYFICYAVFRFFNEFLRGDHNPQHFGQLSDQQVFSVLMFVAFVALLIVLWRSSTPRKEPQ